MSGLLTMKNVNWLLLIAMLRTIFDTWQIRFINITLIVAYKPIKNKSIELLEIHQITYEKILT